MATLRTAIADSWANRASFLVQLAFMVVNDITWIAFWGFFFHRTGTVRGWSFDDVIVLFSLMLTAGGLALGLFYNCRRIGRMASEGEFDEVLGLPVPALAYTLARRVEPANVGDLVFGPVLFAVAGHPTPERALMFAIGAFVATTVIVSFLVIVGSLTFFIGGSGEQGELGFNALFIFAAYPLDFFGGVTKLLLFTVVPVAFVTGIPSELVHHFDLPAATLLLVVAALAVVTASTTFSLGLRRYTSGSIWAR